ncbi:MAG TPA: hypothetical protein VKR06_16365 [Ktedonosporobacter sp.]|nr:hypothetical protein [Ktedonosporobacter sp.]
MLPLRFCAACGTANPRENVACHMCHQPLLLRERYQLEACVGKGGSGIRQDLALTHTLGLALDRHLDAPREVNVMFTTRTMQEWDPTFVANVRRDGIVLYQRGPLPAPLHDLNAA